MTPEQATALISALAALATAVAGLVVAVAKLWAKVEENHRAIDGRVNDLVATARSQGHAEGVLLAEQLRAPGATESGETLD